MSTAVPWESINEKLPFARNKVGFLDLFRSRIWIHKLVTKSALQVVFHDEAY